MRLDCLVALGVIFFMYSLNANANTCTNKIGSASISVGNIIVQRDLAVGSAISNEIIGSEVLAYTCAITDYNGDRAGVKSNILPFYGMSSDGDRIYKTNLPGVGVTIGVTDRTIEGSSYTNIYSGFIGQPDKYGLNPDVDSFYGGWRTSNLNTTHYHYLTPKVRFWKIGPIQSGILAGQYATYKANGNSAFNGPWAPDESLNFASGTITQVACSIRTPNLTFPIGDVLASYFGSTVGTIPSGAQNTQYLGLDCDAGANINVTLQGTQNPDVSTTSVLALTGQGNADVARGVGVQLLYNGAPLVLNNRIVLKQSAGGQETFPLTARYYQTKTSVSTGKANASATLDLTYQ